MNFEFEKMLENLLKQKTEIDAEIHYKERDLNALREKKAAIDETIARMRRE